MLEPTDRLMLVDALRPPDGYGLDTAVGTTFTLELDALLLATVSFAVFDHTDTDNGRPDPMALLESVRRHAQSITVFAQAGALSGPRQHPPVLAYLEESVVPVRPPRPGHLFHPKVWAIRFAPDGAKGTTTSSDGMRYRLLVMSRNLTFDSSWDTIVQLDGKPVTEAQHHALGDFFDSLPELALSPLSTTRSAEIGQLAEELRSVQWELPPGVETLSFHPMGKGLDALAITGDRVLVMSPFLSRSTVQTLGSGSGANVLVSRPPALDGVGQRAVSGFAETFVIDSSDELAGTSSLHDADSDPTSPAEVPLDIEPPRAGCELSGLHAKVFVTETDNTTTLWLGSANATDAAFKGNSEFMVELGLRRDQFSIDSMLDGTTGGPNLRSMLLPYVPSSLEPVAPDPLETAIRELDRLVREAAELAYRVHVSGIEDGYHLDISWRDGEKIASQMAVGKYSLLVGPATHAARSAPFLDGGVSIGPVTLEAVTSFLVLEARTTVGGQEVISRSLVNARLSGEPSDRKEKLLARVLDDPDKVLRYLLFLLAELTGDDSLIRAFGLHDSREEWTFQAINSPPLLETLLRALAHAPSSLDHVAEFVRDMTASNSELLPPGFATVWAPIDAARREPRD